MADLMRKALMNRRAKMGAAQPQVEIDIEMKKPMKEDPSQMTEEELQRTSDLAPETEESREMGLEDDYELIMGEKMPERPLEDDSNRPRSLMERMRIQMVKDRDRNRMMKGQGEY